MSDLIDLARRIADDAGTVSGKLVVDLGAGTGLIARAFEAKGARVVATDINEVALRKYKGIKVVSDVRLLPFKDEVFDVVAWRSLMVWIDDRPSICREAIRVLKPGSAIVGSESLNAQLDIKVEHDGLEEIWEFVAKALVGLQPMTLTDRSVTAFLKEAGFTKISIDVESELHTNWNPSSFFFDERGPSGFSLAEYLVSGGIDAKLISGFAEGLAKNSAQLVTFEGRFRAIKPPEGLEVSA